MASDTLTVIDNRTGKQYEVPITDGTIPSMELRKIKASADDFGLPDRRARREHAVSRSGVAPPPRRTADAE